MDVSITCERFFDGAHLAGPTRVVVEDSVVVAIESVRTPTDHHLVCPGFVDIQMNGFGGHDVADLNEKTARELDEHLASLGTTSWLGTLVTAPLPEIAERVRNLSSLMETDVMPGCVGIHLEGPFLGRAPGAHDTRLIVPFDQAWTAQLPPGVRLMTIAPENVDSFNALSNLTRAGIHVSLGHTRASAEQFQLAVNAGATMVTHLFNGMSGVHHRDDGVALAALTDDRVRVGLIGDMVHVRPEAINLAFRSKPAGGVVLVSDSIAWESTWARSGGVLIRDGAPRLPDGTLAGSSTPLSECVRNVVEHCRVSLEVALRAATSSPADAVGLDECGYIRVGSSADIISLDEDLHPVETWRRLPFGRDQQFDL